MRTHGVKMGKQEGGMLK